MTACAFVHRGFMYNACSDEVVSLLLDRDFLRRADTICLFSMKCRLLRFSISIDGTTSKGPLPGTSVLTLGV